ncbi:TfoX/Sxy family protein [Inhella sp.]|uniref:TfoX/Sxy family protein n=1 Tax=Inhella sp. TaxID=1921806 RepID=UPI0035B34D6D
MSKLRPADEEPFVAHCRELLGPLGPVRTRRMFGAVGLYVDGLFIALIEDEVLYLKGHALHQAAFEAAGCRRFEYLMKDGSRAHLNYWSAPETAMESPAEMRPWALRAIDAALKKSAK